MCIGWVGDTPNAFRVSPEYRIYWQVLINTQNHSGWTIEPVSYNYEHTGMTLQRENINRYDLIVYLL